MNKGFGLFSRVTDADELLWARKLQIAAQAERIYQDFQKRRGRCKVKPAEEKKVEGRALMRRAIGMA